MKLANKILNNICENNKKSFKGKDGEIWSIYSKDHSKEQAEKINKFIDFMDNAGKKNDTESTHKANLKRGSDKFGIPFDYANYLYTYEPNNEDVQ